MERRRNAHQHPPLPLNTSMPLNLGHSDDYGTMVRRGPICIALLLLIAVPLVIVNVVKTSLNQDELRLKLRDTTGGHPQVDTTAGSYTGRLWTTDQTVGKKLLGETSLARCDVHSVLSGDGKHIVKDWIFLEEQDAINVAVLTTKGQFLLWQHPRTYAIPGETLSPVGGFIGHGESPFHAAQRHVTEQLGMGSQHTLQILGNTKQTNNWSGRTTLDHELSNTKVDEFGLAQGLVETPDETDWIFLGRYRTMANRGGGFLYSYLLVNAVPLVEGGGTTAFWSSSDDPERRKLLQLTTTQLAAAVAHGKFQEVKATATMSLALLHLQAQKS